MVRQSQNERRITLNEPRGRYKILPQTCAYKRFYCFSRGLIFNWLSLSTGLLTNPIKQKRMTFFFNGSQTDNFFYKVNRPYNSGQ
jgi:hypothetical protein